MKVATGLAIGREANPNLAAQAVKQAMLAADITIASSVLLFLTSEFARDPVPALRAAAKAASCTQIMGCSAPGLFTEQDWILDVPAAAALVLSDGAALVHPSTKDANQLLLALAAPNAINTTWMSGDGMSVPGIRFGGVSGDAIGQGPFSVWQNGKGAVVGHCEAALQGVKGVVAAAHGLRILDKPKLVTKAGAHDLQMLADKPALKVLQRACDEVNESIPLHRIMAVYAKSAEAISAGDYQQAALVSCNDSDQSTTLSKSVETGQFLCWALRETEAAQQDLQQTAANLNDKLRLQTNKAQPDFGLLFSCLGRGPYFYGGVDRDLSLLRAQFPGMPLIGFYGNGEIAPSNFKQDGGSELLPYSAVVGPVHPCLISIGAKLATLFNPSRDQVRHFFFDTWAKYKQQQPLADIEAIAVQVMQLHPEYHAVLDAPDRYLEQEYFPEMGETNPFLHMSLHLSVLEHIGIDQPPGIAQAYGKLQQKHRDTHNAQHDLLDCLAETLWQAQRDGGPPNAEIYLGCMQRKSE